MAFICTKLRLGSNITGSKGCYKGKIEYRAPGYLEGIGGFIPPIIGGNVTGTWGGKEMVYDFATMERAEFSYIGPGIIDSLFGGGIALYVGGVLGFRSDSNIIKDYAGPFIVGQKGLSVDLGIGFGTGFTKFTSVIDPGVRGKTWYIGGSLSADLLELFDVGVAYLDYQIIKDSRKAYKMKDGTINRTELVMDIIFGNSSPWYTTPISKYSRAFFSVIALNYARVYEELGND